MNSFNLTLSGKHFICPSILNESFATLLACKVYFEKSADSLMGTPLQVIVSFSLAAFKILSLSLTFGILIMMCLGVVLFVSILFGILWASWTCVSITLPNSESFLSLFVQISFQFLALLFSFWHPYDLNVGTFEVVPEDIYAIIILKKFFFSSCCSDWLFSLPYVPNS